MKLRLFVAGLGVVVSNGYAEEALQMAAYFGLAMAGGDMALYIAAASFGVTVGNLQMLMPLMIAEGFGLKAYARILSVNQMITTLANAGGPAVVGLLYTFFAGYEIPYLILIAFPASALLILVAAGPVRALLDAQEAEAAHAGASGPITG